MKTILMVLVICMSVASCEQGCNMEMRGLSKIDTSSLSKDILCIVDSYTKKFPTYKSLYMSNNIELPYVDKDAVEYETSCKLFVIGRLSKYMCYNDTNTCTGTMHNNIAPFPTSYIRYKGVVIFLFSSKDALISDNNTKIIFDRYSEDVRFTDKQNNPMWLIAIRKNGRASILSRDIWTFQSDRANPHHLKFMAPVLRR